MQKIPLPTSSWRPGDVGMLALFRGRLTESQPGVLTADGTALLWPAGFSAVRPSEGPVQVLDPEGNVVLEVGDTFEVAGGSGGEGVAMNGYPARVSG